MKKLYLRSLIALFFSGFYIQANADEVIVKSNQSNLSQYFDNCNNIRIGCVADLYSTLDIINSTKFQNKLDFNQSEKFEIDFPAGKINLKSPMSINWENKVQLLLKGNVRRTIVSGAIESKLLPLSVSDPNFSKIPSNIRPFIYTAKFPIFNHKNVVGAKHPTVPTSGELFWNNQIATLARWPNHDFAKIGDAQLSSKTFNLNEFKGNIHDPQLEAHGFWNWDWADQIYPIKQNQEGSFTILQNNLDYGIKNNQRIYLQNALELLDSPNEWYQDYKTGTVYFWRPSSMQNTVEFSSVDQLLKINSSKNINVTNLIFEKNRGDSINVQDSKDLIFNNIFVNYSGNSGFRIKNSYNVSILNSKITNTGEGGVYVDGGDRVNLVPSNNVIQNSYFSNNDRIVFSKGSSIDLRGVGNRVLNNIIENTGDNAITFGGNNHIISGNKISNVLQMTSDAGAIYVGRDFTARGTIISNNIISNIVPFRSNGSVVGVYLDDQASGIVIQNNKFLNVQYGVLLGGGRNNTINNNLFEDNQVAIRYDARGSKWQKVDKNSSNNTLISNLNAVPIQSNIWKKEYPDLANILNDQFGQPKYNIIQGNNFIRTKGIRFEGGLNNKSDKGATISSNTETQ